MDETPTVFNEGMDGQQPSTNQPTQQPSTSQPTQQPSTSQPTQQPSTSQPTQQPSTSETRKGSSKTRKPKFLSLHRKHTAQHSGHATWKRTLRVKFASCLRGAKAHGIPDSRPSPDDGRCVCTSYRRTEDHVLGAGIVFSAQYPPSSPGRFDLLGRQTNSPVCRSPDVIGCPKIMPEMEPSVELWSRGSRESSLVSSLSRQCAISTEVRSPQLRYNGSVDEHSTETFYSEYRTKVGSDGPAPTVVHTQIDYIHCLVPDLQKVTNCGYYWGVMDRYEAESLLENKPEGTFLLRDSAQDEFLFSVSFRRYGRSLHARIEQWKHKFSFDSHDPAVFASDSVHGLIEHYKDPGSCLFFEPMLIHPLNRTEVFSLQNLCRAIICSNTTYDGISYLTLPKSLKESLRYYHYKQKVRVRKFELAHV